LIQSRYALIGGGVALVGLFLLLNSLFIVDERQRALVLQFGQVRGQPIEAPGLYLKAPFIQNVVYFEDRILPLETTSLEVTPLDDRRLVVDAFARWRIVDTIRFRQAVFDEAAAVPRLERILNAALRQVLGSVVSEALLSEERAGLMNRIRDEARRNARELGVDVVDVRIRRADLPEQNLQATFQRMQAERQREAADERARGAEAAQRVRANADRQAVELVSEARREAEVIRGEADAQRNAVFAEAFGRDPEFFAFHRSMRAYETALQGQNSTMVMTPDSEFFNYLKNPNGVNVGAAGLN
jgi:membrane protease subunit HflC